MIEMLAEFFQFCIAILSDHQANRRHRLTWLGIVAFCIIITLIVMIKSD